MWELVQAGPGEELALSSKGDGSHWRVTSRTGLWVPWGELAGGFKTSSANFC